ncbi:MAG TPA: hypothetical protein VNN62_04775 [Methylomirabilota bacterium]|jgi:hypothetical protein|nr:hypothetical protein [Methylomirabilota bacterium]
MKEFKLLDNKSNSASLIVGKVYRTLSDPEAEAHGMLRVLDEDKSEPDGYLYPASMFTAIELPEAARQALTAAGV